MKRVTVLRTSLVLALILALEAACRLGIIRKVTMIAPSQMAAELYRLLAAGEVSAHIAKSLSNVLIAFVLSVAGGFALGVLIHRLPRLRRALDPLLVVWYAVPFFVFYPIFIVLFGMNDLPIIVIGFMFGVVAMILNTLNGLDRIPRVLTKTARMHRLSGPAEALLVKLPCAAPYLFTGIKLAVAYSFIGVIAAEFILAPAGLGYSIAYAYNNFETAKMYALMLFIITLVTLVNAAFYVWEKRLMRRRGLL